MHKHVGELMQKEMSRQDFLKTVGVGLLTLFGFSSVMKMMSSMGSGSKVSESGYGSSPYGQ